MKKEAEEIKERLDNEITKMVADRYPMLFYEKRIDVKIRLDECPITTEEMKQICEYLKTKWLEGEFKDYFYGEYFEIKRKFFTKKFILRAQYYHDDL